jgi:inorganic triphosphatase YgiF
VTTSVEVEVKLSVSDADAVRRLIEHPDPTRLAGFRGIDAVAEHMVVDRYVDTADGRLAAAGARARVRVSDTGAVLALKHHGIEARGVTARHEVEAPAADTLDSASWPASVARDELLALTGGAPLVEIARLGQRRQVRVVQRDDAQVELSLDHMEALDGERVTAARWELEAELKAGPREALEELAAALDALPWLSPATGSKLGFALAARSMSRGPQIGEV